VICGFSISSQATFHHSHSKGRPKLYSKKHHVERSTHGHPNTLFGSCHTVCCLLLRRLLLLLSERGAGCGGAPAGARALGAEAALACLPG
jgi:hypothetical protein